MCQPNLPLPSTDGVHRACCNRFDRYVEEGEGGIEYIVPEHLLCPARHVVLMDDTMLWQSSDETHRLQQLLNNDFSGKIKGALGGHEQPPRAEDIIDVVGRQGYKTIGVDYHSADYGMEDEHYLMRSDTNLNLVLSAVYVDNGGGLLLERVDTSTSDREVGCHILRLESEADVKLAKRKGLLCLDSAGHHVQVQLWRSTICQSQVDGILDTELLRGFWRKAVEAGRHDL